MADAVDVDAARGDVGRDQHLGRAVLEAGQRPLAVVLRLVAVDRGGLDAGPEQVAGHLVGAVLGAGEHDGAGDRGLGHELGEHRLLGRLVDMDHALLDPLGRGRGRDDA